MLGYIWTALLTVFSFQTVFLVAVALATYFGWYVPRRHRLERRDKVRAAISSAPDGRLPAPPHIGVAFNRRERIDVRTLVEFCRLALSRSALERLSIYDPWGLCKELSGQVTRQLEESDASRIVWLSQEDGRPRLVEIARKLSVGPLPDDAEKITPEMISTELAACSVTEPDMLLLIGGLPTSAGYPPYAMRVSELVPLQQLPTKVENLDDALFEFAGRQRRLGK